MQSKIYLKRCISITIEVKTGKMCNSCSLKELCLPKLNKQVSVKHYIDQMLKEEET